MICDGCFLNYFSYAAFKKNVLPTVSSEGPTKEDDWGHYWKILLCYWKTPGIITHYADPCCASQLVISSMSQVMEPSKLEMKKTFSFLKSLQVPSYSHIVLFSNFSRS